MKRLYARFVLWLIRPAVQRALHEETRQGGSVHRCDAPMIRATISVAGRSYAAGTSVEQMNKGGLT
ncbi:hypothetical protein J2794_003567 [Paraburkholderia terricola]|uniref:hypothetical protein n=1 Tax=Paraburkholderia terricola TaxID=169427 RepID=UPI00285BEE7A|nr:hypothetical protein [Paraburkholderia terricola]MDR6447451.1 hypothetical protein [Paraburkholderia terricola]